MTYISEKELHSSLVDSEDINIVDSIHNRF